MRIGIVNDMALARESLRRVVQSSPGHEVAWLAVNGGEAIDRALRDPPDLILMDLIMPVTDGVEATRRIMAESPCPILVVTATVSGSVSKVYEAMGHGALDAVDTPTFGPSGDVRGAGPLLCKIDTVGRLTGKAGCRSIPESQVATRRVPGLSGNPLVAVGASTGGPNALAEVIGAFPEDLDASVVVVQHVDVAFAPGLARWLTERSSHRVDTAEPGDSPAPGRILLAATNDHMVLQRGRSLSYLGEPRDLCYRPSVDVFFASLAANWTGVGVAVVLTGMGRDGASGMLALRQLGWHTIAQDQATSVVWGMPRAAAEVGAAVEVLPLARIGPAIVDQVRRLNRIHEAHR